MHEPKAVYSALPRLSLNKFQRMLTHMHLDRFTRHPTVQIRHDLTVSELQLVPNGCPVVEFPVNVGANSNCYQHV